FGGGLQLFPGAHRRRLSVERKAPRPVGSQLAVDGDGNFLGSVSAGCVESAVVEAAAEVIAHGKPKLLEFGIGDDQAWEVGLSCGGNIEIYVEKVE
ncbi:MAG: XdhC family protein, partial [Alphaproteobacteria bacterium]